MEFAELSDDALLDLLTSEEDRLPRAAVDEVLRRAPRLESRLVAFLDDDDEESWAPLHAVFILAAAKTPGALDALLRAFNREGIHEDGFIFETADSILASFGAESVPTLIAACDHATSYANIWINDALAEIARKSPPELRETVRTHLRSAALGDGAVEVRACAAEDFLRLAGPTDRETIDLLVDRGLVDEGDAEQALSGALADGLPQAVDWLRFYNPDVIARRQAIYEDVDESEPDLDGVLPDDPALDVLSRLDSPAEGPAPIVNASAKIGRNDPCPCGSGRKFKKCCAT